MKPTMTSGGAAAPHCSSTPLNTLSDRVLLHALGLVRIQRRGCVEVGGVTIGTAGGMRRTGGDLEREAHDDVGGRSRAALHLEPAGGLPQPQPLGDDRVRADRQRARNDVAKRDEALRLPV